MKRPIHKVAFYRVMRVAFRLAATVLFRYRYFGAENFPTCGGGLICSNHQSNLDPAVVGITSTRHLNFLAKKSLFFFPLSIIIYLLDAIPIDRTGMGIAGIKETLKRAKRGEMILLFPEGRRTLDGELGKLMAGFVAIAKRTKVPLIPVGMDGAFQAWPRNRWLPFPGRIVVVVHPPIQPEEYLDLDDSQIVELLSKRMQACFEEARSIRNDFTRT